MRSVSVLRRRMRRWLGSADPHPTTNRSEAPTVRAVPDRRERWLAPVPPPADRGACPLVARPGPAKVLVVDDDTYVCELLGIVLGIEGYQVHCAGDGISALQTMSWGPDVVLSDLEMPRMGGLELLRFLRARADLRGVPFVLMSGRTEPDVSAAALQGGATSFVAKPFDLPDLFLALERATSM